MRYSSLTAAVETIVRYIGFFVCYTAASILNSNSPALAQTPQELPSQPTITQNSSNQATFELTSAEKITRAYGIILRPSSSRPLEKGDGVVAHSQSYRADRRQASFRQLANNLWSIDVELNESDYNENNQILAVAFTEGDHTISTSVRNVLSSQPLAPPKLVCAPSESTQRIAKLTSLDTETFRSLIRIREERVRFLEGKMRELLTPQMLSRLRQFEKQYYLRSLPPISHDTPVEEIAVRLHTIAGFVGKLP